MIPIKESMGDIELKKFIIVFTPEIADAGVMKYSHDLKCYYYVWKYKYNWLTMEHDPDTTHYETFENIIPRSIRKLATEDNTFVGGLTAYSGKETAAFSAGLGTPSMVKRVALFVNKVFPNVSEYNHENESAFSFSL